MKTKEINQQVNEALTSEKEKAPIWEAKYLYHQLQK